MFFETQSLIHKSVYIYVIKQVDGRYHGTYSTHKVM